MLNLTVMMIPVYLVVMAATFIMEDSLAIYIAFFNIILSSLITAVIFMFYVIKKPNSMKKINFYMVFYCVFYLIPSIPLLIVACFAWEILIIMVPIVFIFLFGLLFSNFSNSNDLCNDDFAFEKESYGSALSRAMTLTDNFGEATGLAHALRGK